ncbi:Thermostable hemolysin [Bordetella sputigena]|uniref:thermostable hemolysin n=1 Tax=Bordetella sputigena TaxID=1416810 RepID=UPI0039F04A39
MHCLEFLMSQRRGPSSSIPWSPGGGGQQPLLQIHQPHDPVRHRVESYIAQRYRQRYGANLKEWLPTLVSVQADGEIVAAAGYRPASQPLFLERYLTAPVERYIREDGVPVRRESIVEVGHFAAMRPGAGRLLVPLLVAHLHRQGYEWAVCTLTAELHHLFARMGLAHRSLAVASAASLDERERQDWGDYYAHGPEVFSGHLRTILQRFGEQSA